MSKTLKIKLGRKKYKFDGTLIEPLYLLEKEYDCKISELPETIEAQAKLVYFIFKCSNKPTGLFRRGFKMSFEQLLNYLSAVNMSELLPKGDQDSKKIIPQ